ncbi:phenylacetate-CoA oxygenase subunit PaaC [Fodinisporobacter ferrooxydans]|uniref:Phenylacetate-CoA oxygenase subunit PaaC n=1 Tax=Fodinisporobacter ferrooxydans TaxID=2901836 RepID=A0ABY4CS76_9BACL|nr:phenylacetate-CoA oxygenase subunit PaaC [Alicyclobacillaceae bacterium MYW30-H2]
MANIRQFENAVEAKKDQEYLEALNELLFQLADDDFILAYRGSEWLGLAPHIEEDVAFSSMSQDTMGHAVMFYGMLEQLGAGKADDLSQLRSATDFRNAVLVERKNGTGHYMEEPHYDWAYAIVRWFFYGLFKQVRLESLTHSSYLPLVQVSKKILTEHRYHLYHLQVWMNQLANSTAEARKRLSIAIEKVWADVGGVFLLGPKASEIVGFGLLEGEDLLTQRWIERAKKAFDDYKISWIGKPDVSEWNGRNGQHSAELAEAVATLSEVYRLDPTAGW